MRRNSHTHRFLNESDFPYTADEILEQIDNAASYYIKELNKYTRDFKKVLNQYEFDIFISDSITICMTKLNVLNYARACVESAENGLYSLEESFDDIKTWCLDNMSTNAENYEDAFYSLQHDNRTRFMSFIK